MDENPEGVLMKVNVNFDLCTSNAVCMGIAPEIFEVRDDGFLYILNENPGAELEERVREAVASCPNGAISIEE
jgi:ferredoxin